MTKVTILVFIFTFLIGILVFQDDLEKVGVLPTSELQTYQTPAFNVHVTTLDGVKCEYVVIAKYSTKAYDKHFPESSNVNIVIDQVKLLVKNKLTEFTMSEILEIEDSLKHWILPPIEKDTIKGRVVYSETRIKYPEVYIEDVVGVMFTYPKRIDDAQKKIVEKISDEDKLKIEMKIAESLSRIGVATKREIE